MSLIRIEDIAHVRFSAPDLTKMRGFLDDFGLASSEVDGRLYARGTDGRPFVHVTEKGDPAFLALGLRARDIADLAALAYYKYTGLFFQTLDMMGGAYALLASVLVGRFMRGDAPDAAHSPAVTILKPLHLEDPDLRANLETFFSQTYAGPAVESLTFQNARGQTGRGRDGESIGICSVLVLQLGNNSLHKD